MVLFILPLTSNAQIDKYIHSNASFAEKVYLQFDGKVYSADNIGEMMVIVEAISEKGKIGYQEIEYEIEGKEKEIIILNW